jgi:Arc/MetJ-type ribon-helix-helix transcriptional regulator
VAVKQLPDRVRRPGIYASRCDYANVAKVRTTLTIDDEVLRAVKLRAAQSGRGDSEVIEEALRRDLGVDFLEEMWRRATLGPEEAEAVAIEAQHATRGRGARR